MIAAKKGGQESHADRPTRRQADKRARTEGQTRRERDTGRHKRDTTGLGVILLLYIETRNHGNIQNRNKEHDLTEPDRTTENRTEKLNKNRTNN